MTKREILFLIKKCCFSINGKTCKSESSDAGIEGVGLAGLAHMILKSATFHTRLSKRLRLFPDSAKTKMLTCTTLTGLNTHSRSMAMMENFGANQNVAIKLNKKTYNVKTNNKGIASLTIPKTVKPGSYAITATYNGQTIKNKIKVKQVLKLKNVKVKKSAKKLILKATLKQGKKALKNKRIAFRFNGKKYAAKTNK